jgi:predicted HicB family RNase H-like nuclease
MTGKKVAIGLKPGVQKSADQWVTEPPARGESPARAGAMKRLTIDVSEELHRKLKVKAASEGVKMADLVRTWIMTAVDTDALSRARE